MEIDDFMDQILMLKDKELEQKVWEFWLVKWPTMGENSFESYEEMLNRTKQCEVTKNQEAQHGLYIDQVFF